MNDDKGNQPVHKAEGSANEPAEETQQAPPKKHRTWNVDPSPCNASFGGSPLVGMFR